MGISLSQQNLTAFLLETVSVQHRRTPPWHLASNGLVERLVQSWKPFSASFLRAISMHVWFVVCGHLGPLPVGKKDLHLQNCWTTFLHALNANAYRQPHPKPFGKYYVDSLTQRRGMRLGIEAFNRCQEMDSWNCSELSWPSHVPCQVVTGRSHAKCVRASHPTKICGILLF